MVDVTAFHTKLTTFRQEIPDAQQKVDEIDSTISKYREEIHNLKLQKASILEREGLLKKEATIAIQKVKESKTFQQEIAALVEHGKALDDKLTYFKGKLDKLKSEFII